MQPEETARRPGRPGIGGRATIALGTGTLACVDVWAEEDGTSRAAWVRQAVEEAILPRAADELAAR